MSLDWLHLSDLVPYKTKLSGDANQVSKFSVGYLESEQMASSRAWGPGRKPFEGALKEQGVAWAPGGKKMGLERELKAPDGNKSISLFVQSQPGIEYP